MGRDNNLAGWGLRVSTGSFFDLGVGVGEDLFGTV